MISVPLKLDQAPPKINTADLDNRVTQEEFNHFWYELRSCTAGKDQIARILGNIHMFILAVLIIWLLVALFGGFASGMILVGVLAGYVTVYTIFCAFWEWRISKCRSKFVFKQNLDHWNSRNLNWEIDNGYKSWRYPTMPRLILRDIPDINITFTDYRKTM